MAVRGPVSIGTIGSAVSPSGTVPVLRYSAQIGVISCTQEPVLQCRHAGAVGLDLGARPKAKRTQQCSTCKLPACAGHSSEVRALKVKLQLWSGCLHVLHVLIASVLQCLITAAQSETQAWQS